MTDGEFRRSYWHLDFFWGLQGIQHTHAANGYFFHGEETRNDTARLSGKVAYQKHPFLDHFAYVKRIAGSLPVRQTIPAPAQCYAELLRDGNEGSVQKFYGNDLAALRADISAAYRKVILDFDLGCRNVQLDDCTWGMLCDTAFWNKMGGEGLTQEQLQKIYLELNNKAIENLPQDLVVTTHVCRGNYHSTWATSGGYEPVAQVLFGKENVSAFYLEFDTDRAGGFEPLRYVADDKYVVLGLVTSKSGKLEDRASIISRIEAASEYVQLDQLCLSPQCGFASTEEGNILSEEQQWNKIKFICEVAKEVWGD